MLRKLLAAMVAATLMAGSAWAANDIVFTPPVATSADDHKKAEDDDSAQSGDRLIFSGTTADIAGGVGGTGGAATYSVDGPYTMYVGSTQTLNVKGGAADSSDAGENATLVIGDLTATRIGGALTVDGTLAVAAGADATAAGGNAGVTMLSGTTLTNNGTITVAAATTAGGTSTLAFADGSTYANTTGSTISLAGEMVIGGALDAAGDPDPSAISTGITGLGKIFADTALAGTGTITVNVADNKNLGTDDLVLKSSVANGAVEIVGAGTHTIGNTINIGNADLTINANTLVTMEGAITAKTVTTDTNKVVFKSDVNAAVITGAAVDFIGPNATLNGSLTVTGTDTVTIGEGAQITIATGKALVFGGGGTIAITGEGSSLQLNSGADYTTGTGVITVADKSSVSIDAGIVASGVLGTTFGTAVGDVTLSAAGSVLNITNTSSVANYTGNVAVGTATASAGASTGIVNLDFAGGKITGNVDAKGAVLNITNSAEITGTVDAANSVTATATTPAGIAIAANKTVTVGGLVTSGSGISVGDGATATFNAGATATTGDVVLGANSTTNVSGAALTITTGNLVTKAGSTATFTGGVNSAGDVSVTGQGTTQEFSGANTATNFTVGNGATLATGTGPVTFVSNGANTGVFAVNQGGTLDLTKAGAAIGGTTFDKVNLNGDIIVGMNTGIANTLTVSGDEANVNGTALGFTSAFGLGVVGASDPTGTGATTNNKIADFTGVTGDVTGLALGQTVNVKNIYGDYTLKFSDGTDANTGNTAKILYVASSASRLTGLGDFDDRALAQTNLQNGWADYNAGAEIDYSLASAVYDAVVGLGGTNPDFTLTADLDGSDAEFGGQLAIDLLTDMANPDTANYTQGVGKSIFRQGNVSETLNAGVGEIRGVTSAIGTRNTQLRGQLAGAAGVSYEYANPTLLLNNDYANRIWAGYLGQWEKGDTRNGVEGYNYDSHGFIVGYDRLVGCNFAFGGAFAYSRGDYEDKAALTNSSKIDNYSFNGYATYSALNGVFASLFGGYTHQKNDIEASYRGGATGTLFKSSDYDSDYWNIGGQLGYDFQPVAGLVLTPSIGLQYINGKSESHVARAWNTPGFFDSYVDGATQEALLLPIEIAARYTIDFSNCSRLAIEGNIGYSYNFIDNNGAASMAIANVQNGSGNPVIIEGYDRDAGRHTFNAGAGLRYTYDRFDIGLKYDYYLQQDAHAHRLMGTVGLSF